MLGQATACQTPWCHHLAMVGSPSSGGEESGSKGGGSFLTIGNGDCYRQSKTSGPATCAATMSGGASQCSKICTPTLTKAKNDCSVPVKAWFTSYVFQPACAIHQKQCAVGSSVSAFMQWFHGSGEASPASNIEECHCGSYGWVHCSSTSAATISCTWVLRSA